MTSHLFKIQVLVFHILIEISYGKVNFFTDKIILYKSFGKRSDEQSTNKINYHCKVTSKVILGMITLLLPNSSS